MPVAATPGAAEVPLQSEPAPKPTSANIDNLPLECLQKVAEYLRGSPFLLPRHPSSPLHHKSKEKANLSSANVHNFALVNRHLNRCITPMLYAFPVLQTEQQTTLLYRTIVSNGDRSGLIKGIRLDVSHGMADFTHSRSSGASTEQVAPARVTRHGENRAIVCLPEDPAAVLVAELLFCLPTIKILILDQLWLYQASCTTHLLSALFSLRPREIHFFGSAPALTNIDGCPFGAALAVIMPWLLSNAKLRVLDINDLAMHESLSSLSTPVSIKPLDILRFKIREGSPIVTYPELVQPLGSFFRPKHVDFTFLALGYISIGHRLVTGTFTGLDSLALHADLAELEEPVYSEPMTIGQQVHWENFGIESQHLPPKISVHTDCLGDPTLALQGLPPHVEHLCLCLDEANPATLLIHAVALLREQRGIPKGLKVLRLDLTQSRFESQAQKAFKSPRQGPGREEGQCLTLWRHLEPTARRLADLGDIELQMHLDERDVRALTYSGVES